MTDKAYRVYVTEALRIITGNTAHLSNDGQYISVRFSDIIEPPKEETRTPDEIIDHILGGLSEL